MTACGEWGTLEWDGVRNTVALSLSDAPSQEMTFDQTRDEIMLAQARAFLDTRSGKSDPRMATGRDGVMALAVCDAARRSTESRREEQVGYLQAR